MNIVFTGSATDPEGVVHERAELIDQCEHLGWRIQRAVDSTTTALVASDGAIRSGTVKIRSAQRAGVQVRPYSWFFAHLRAEQRSRADHARAASRGQTVRTPASEVRSGFLRGVDGMTPASDPPIAFPEFRHVRQVVNMDGIVHDVVTDCDGNELRRVRSPDVSDIQRRGRRVLPGPSWHPWTSPPHELSSMEFDWVETWADRSGREAQWRMLVTGEVRYRLLTIQGRTVCEDVPWSVLRETVDRLRQEWVAKNEPPEPTPFRSRTVRRKLL